MMATAMIRAKRPPMAGRKYMSEIDSGVSVGAGVITTSSTEKNVVACEGQ